MHYSNNVAQITIYYRASSIRKTKNSIVELVLIFVLSRIDENCSHIEMYFN